MIRNFVVLCAVLSLSLVAFGQESAQAPKAEIFVGTSTSTQIAGFRASVALT